jgi:hypothetical protein
MTLSLKSGVSVFICCLVPMLILNASVSSAQSHSCNATTLNNKVAPGSNFDLSLYSLTTPDDKTISSSSLESGYSSNWFYTDSSDGSMTFWCPSQGSATTHAEYPRSELHHHCDSSDSNKHWFVQSGSHKMFLQMRIDEQSTFDKMIIGQIFGADYDHPLLKMYWDSGQLYAEYRNDANGDQTKVVYEQDVNYQKFDFEFEAYDSLIKAFVNNEQLLSWNVSSYWTQSGNYFKSGNYIQTNEEGDYHTIVHTYCVQVYNSGACQTSPP